MIEKYTPPTLRLNIQRPNMYANTVGTANIKIRVNGKLLNGTQNQGNSVSWFQSIKSGIPGVD